MEISGSFHKEFAMRKIFYAVGIVALLLAVAGLAISFIKQETLIEAVEKQLSYLTIALFTLAATTAVSAMRESVYGGWRLEIFIESRLIEQETQRIRSSKAEEIIQYVNGWGWAWLGWDVVDFIKDDPLEDFLRRRCKSQGEIIGDPFQWITFNPNQPKTIWFDVPENCLQRPKPN